MKSSDLQIRPAVGQYWFNRYDLTLHKVTEVEDTKVTFDVGSSYVPPLSGSFVYMWHTMIIHRASFQEVAPEFGQVWVSNPSQDVFLIHPDQAGLDPAKGIRVLSDSSRLEGAAFLLKNTT